MSDFHVAVNLNPVNGKYCVYVLVGACDTFDAAKKFAEEAGQLVGKALVKK